MNLIRKSKLIRPIAMFLTLLMVFQVALPLSGFALTSGPSQPEFSSFEPVSTVKMVDEFSGSLTYNLPLLEIPGPEGGSYPLALSYHSGANPEEDASWVGFGWTLNPGAIQRSKSGYPDDYKNEQVIDYNRVPDNWTVGLGVHASGEVFSADLSNSLSGSIRYNNYRGFGYSASVSQNTAIGSLGYSLSDGDGSFSASINVAKVLNRIKYGKEKESINISQNPSAQQTKWQKFWNPRASSQKNRLSNFGFSISGQGQRPSSVTPYIGTSVNFTVSNQTNLLPIPVGPEYGIDGSFSHQHNVGEKARSAFGYLYSHAADESSLMDYYTERSAPFEKHDHYMGIPFSSPDNFSATGAAVSGSFRPHSKRTGHFSPNKATSATIIAQGQIEIMAGPSTGLGADIGLGLHTLSVNEWDSDNYEFSDDGDEPYFFRFAGDMGGTMNIGNNLAEQATPSIILNSVDLPSSIPAQLNSGQRVARSGFIGYSFNSEMDDVLGGNLSHSISKCTSVVNDPLVNRQASPDGIGEFSVVNSSGIRYNYGTPVYSKNEHELSYLIRKASAFSVVNNYKVYDDYTKEDARYVVGREMPGQYASQYLLTEILQPDYLDRGLNGPSDDDFGGWTKFSYEKVHGHGMPNWYKWRMPYNGLLYDRNELSSDLDDVGTVRYGEKEVYFLEQIETRTHIAKFILSDREDGIDAETNESTASSSQTARGNNGLKKLDKIELWKKDASGQPSELIKTVHFEYDYSSWACGNLPNSSANNVGKLTLRRVWFDYENAVNARISPYEFFYQYPQTGSGSTVSCALPNFPGNATIAHAPQVDYPSIYNQFENYGAGKNELPSYDPQNIDPWGCYQADGGVRQNQFKSWMNQVPTASFDPAAYQLKAVKFPSGGQIHVQYEQNEYRWVQDRHASAMVGITAGPNSHEYYLKTVDDLGILLSDARTAEIRDMIHQMFIRDKQKLYFKFLYSLTHLTSPNISDCDAEFIDGYVTVSAVDFVAGSGNPIKITIGPTSGAAYDYPENVCDDFLRTQRAGNVQPGVSCDASSGALNNAGGPATVFHSLVGAISNPYGIYGCGNNDLNNSYFRIPIPAKKGGGIRVKRILMYDKGLEPGGEDKVLYGTEYEYNDEDGICSGVISKEPGAVSFEDPLKTPLDQTGQAQWARILSGRDRTELEGPLGESIIPETGVGYGRVLAKNIHSGRTSAGYTVNEYYTYKDYPFDARYQEIGPQRAVDATPIKKKRVWIPEIGGLLPITYGKDNRFNTQGYRFVQYNIHGQPKRFSTYAGTYDPGPQTMSPTGMKMVASQHYQYFEPGENLPMMDDLHYNANNGWYPGKEAEIITESRKVNDITVNARFETDLSINFVGVPLPLFGLFLNLNYSEKKLKTHVTTKIERYPAIQKRVISYQDGITHVTENIAFNPETGSPILTKSTDSYDGLFDLEANGLSTTHDGSYHSYVIPASREYPALKAKALTEKVRLPVSGGGFTVNKINIAGQRFIELDNQAQGSNPVLCQVLSSLCAGSRVEISDGSSVDGIYTLGNVNGNTIELLSSAFYPSDLLGTTFQNGSLTVLESGCQNRLEEGVGAFTTYGPIGTITNNSSTTTAENQIREATYAVPLNNLLASITSGPVPPFATTNCVFKNTHSDDVEIRLTTTIGSGNPYLNIELVDWANGAVISRCIETIPNFEGGSFQISDVSGELVYMPDGADCNPFKLPCLEFCENNSVVETIQDVVVAEAVTLEDNWPYNYSLYGSPASNANVYESGERGKWRALGSYKYRSDIKGGAKDFPIANSQAERNYNGAGVFPLDIFNYQNHPANDDTKWLMASIVTQYSPFGMATEEHDILGIYGNAHFGYHFTVPTMTGKNSNYEKCYFESFEVEYGLNTGRIEEGVTVNHNLITSKKAHAGNQCYILMAPIQLRPFTMDNRTLDNGFSIMAWVQGKKFSKVALHGSVNFGSISFPLDFKWQAKTGQWSLYEAKILPNASWGILPNQGSPVTNAITIELFKNPSLVDTIWVDDIRYQPLDAQAACYVYDPNTLKPLVTFDDQHFGVYNQYDGEGKLVRKLIETERGMRTVQETQIHSPNQLRPQ